MSLTRIRAHAPAAAELDPEERMSRDELEDLQLSRLQQTVRHAYANVPLYTQKFDALAAEGDRVAGPVGGIVGGAVGGAVGTVNGALGIDPGRRAYRTRMKSRRPAHRRRHR